MSSLSAFATSVANHSGTLVAINSKGKRVGFDLISLSMMLSTILPPILETLRNCKKKRQEAVDPVSLRNHVATNMGRFSTAERQENALMKEIDKEIDRQKKIAQRAAAEGGVLPEWARFDVDSVAKAKLAHNIIGKFSTCSDSEVIELCRDANGVYVAQTSK